MRPFAGALLTYRKAHLQSHAGVTITNLSESPRLRQPGHLMEQLQTHRVVLRPFTPADAPEAFACITERLTRYLAWEAPRTIHEFRLVWEGWINAARAGSDLHFVARLSQTDEFLGLLGLHRIPSTRPEIGIWLRDEAQGQGHGQDMVAALIRRATARYAPPYFRYPVAVENRPSRRIAEKLGGTIIGRYRTQKLDGVIYAIPPIG